MKRKVLRITVAVLLSLTFSFTPAVSYLPMQNTTSVEAANKSVKKNIKKLSNYIKENGKHEEFSYTESDGSEKTEEEYFIYAADSNGSSGYRFTRVSANVVDLVYDYDSEYQGLSNSVQFRLKGGDKVEVFIFNEEFKSTFYVKASEFSGKTNEATFKDLSANSINLETGESMSSVSKKYMKKQSVKMASKALKKINPILSKYTELDLSDLGFKNY